MIPVPPSSSGADTPHKPWNAPIHCSSQSSGRRKRREEMVSIATAVATPTVARATAVRKAATGAFSTSPVLGLPKFGVRGGRVRCSASDEKAAAAVPAVGKTATLLAAAAATTMSVSNHPALALVDERMSTEGTGLSLGLSNNLLGWILFGVFGLIWALYFVYTSTLDEDDESGGLSL